MIAILSLVLLSTISFCAPGDRSKVEYGVKQLQGRRPTMEDAHDIRIMEAYAFFGLYDGHGGREVADYAQNHLHANCNLADLSEPEMIRNALAIGFLKTHEEVNTSKIIDTTVQGSTAIVAFIHNARLYVANAGDSRAVLCKTGVPIPLSQDHKAGRPDEKARIEQLGGQVIVACNRTQFVLPDRGDRALAVSRALGDKNLQPYVIADPEITERALEPDDEFLILACDGVWDVLTNEYAVQVVQKSLQTYPGNVAKAAQSLVIEAYLKKSQDNISAIVVNLRQ